MIKKNEYQCSEYHTERLKSILNELFSFCNTYNRNYIAICGINDFMWDKLITHGCYYNNPYFGVLIEESKDKNEVIINYKGNHVLLKKSSKPTITHKNQYAYNWDIFEKPNLSITDIHELDDDTTDN